MSFYNSSNTHMGTPSLSVLWTLHEVTYLVLVNSSSWCALLIIIYLILRALGPDLLPHLSACSVHQYTWTSHLAVCGQLLLCTNQDSLVERDRNPSQTSWSKRRGVLVPRLLVQTLSVSCTSALVCILASISHWLPCLISCTDFFHTVGSGTTIHSSQVSPQRRKRGQALLTGPKFKVPEEILWWT